VTLYLPLEGCSCKWIVNRELAEEMNKIFLEVVIAGEFTDGAIEVFSSKKRIKLFSQTQID